MIHFDCVQGSQEWHDARLGIPTSSKFGEIVTPGGDPCKPDKTRRYMNVNLAEWLQGDSEEQFQSKYMDRGYLTQPEALDYYTFVKDTPVLPVGLYLHDDRRSAASTDGAIGSVLDPDLLIEAKCPSNQVQMEFIRSGKVPRIYWPQIQGTLWITGKDRCDFVCYHSDLPSGILRVDRDEALIEAIALHVGIFCDVMEQERAAILARGYKPTPPRSAKGDD